MVAGNMTYLVINSFDFEEYLFLTQSYPYVKFWEEYLAKLYQITSHFLSFPFSLFPQTTQYQ